MSEHSRTIVLETSKKELEGGGGEEDIGSSSTARDTEEGYQTPTSEEHRIPPVDLSHPPPPPRKRRRRVTCHRRSRAPNAAEAVDEIMIRIKAELELFFQSCDKQSRVQSEPGPITGPKKRQTHDR
ncbi:hypothetical protein ABFS82_14G237500 [Erythranthe guttata]|uniref:cyclin-dependent protein kinase inhibitor SMR2 n=1 Tax=Erythranthe guttata TaxID=4155 RepID=UPI00064D9113|nr:PREDICTED: cyclin-dependent protein kinase inhibitor SMR2 [Erythranthe guttata]|eukprot:XP_012838166.1 PREDICTED: cyclin-dependent protein kinase inhibitor SMR2 [Erythranthe guttata]